VVDGNLAKRKLKKEDDKLKNLKVTDFNNKINTELFDNDIISY